MLDGRLKEARLREAAEHVAGLVKRTGGLHARGEAGADGAAVVEAAVREGVRVLRSPVRSTGGDRPAVLSLIDNRLTMAESAEAGDPLLVAARRRGLAVEADLDAAVAGRGPLVVGVRRPDGETLARLEALTHRRPTTVIALAEPWLLDRLTGAGAIAACDGGRTACERALELALG